MAKLPRVPVSPLVRSYHVQPAPQIGVPVPPQQTFDLSGVTKLLGDYHAEIRQRVVQEATIKAKNEMYQVAENVFKNPSPEMLTNLQEGIAEVRANNLAQFGHDKEQINSFNQGIDPLANSLNTGMLTATVQYYEKETLANLTTGSKQIQQDVAQGLMDIPDPDNPGQTITNLPAVAERINSLYHDANGQRKAAIHNVGADNPLFYQNKIQSFLYDKMMADAFTKERIDETRNAINDGTFQISRAIYEKDGKWHGKIQRISLNEIHSFEERVKLQKHFREVAESIQKDGDDIRARELEQRVLQSASLLRRAKRNMFLGLLNKEGVNKIIDDGLLLPEHMQDLVDAKEKYVDKIRATNLNKDFRDVFTDFQMIYAQMSLPDQAAFMADPFAAKLGITNPPDYLPEDEEFDLWTIAGYFPDNRPEIIKWLEEEQTQTLSEFKTEWEDRKKTTLDFIDLKLGGLVIFGDESNTIRQGWKIRNETMQRHYVEKEHKMRMAILDAKDSPAVNQAVQALEDMRARYRADATELAATIMTTASHVGGTGQLAADFIDSVLTNIDSLEFGPSLSGPDGENWESMALATVVLNIPGTTNRPSKSIKLFEPFINPQTGESDHSDIRLNAQAIQDLRTYYADSPNYQQLITDLELFARMQEKLMKYPLSPRTGRGKGN